MKKIVFFAVLLQFSLHSCSDKEFELLKSSNTDFGEPLSGVEVNKLIEESLAKGQPFNFKDATLHQLWSAVSLSDGIVNVGFGVGENNIEKSTIPNAAAIEKDLYDLIEKHENKKIKDILRWTSEDISSFVVTIKNPETLKALRSHKNTVYVDPINYDYNKHLPASESYKRIETFQSGAGCEKDKSTTDIKYESYMNNAYTYPRPETQLFKFNNMKGTPTARVPEFFFWHNLDQAYKWGYYGQGIKMAIIDSGISANNPVFNANWNKYDKDRTMQKWEGTKEYDVCGHGTAMVAVAAAPPSIEGKPMGVAPRANMISYRVTDNGPVFDGNVAVNIANAFGKLTADPEKVKIISISMGSPIAWGSVLKAILSASRKNVLIFAAAGTSPATNIVGNVVVFPANMEEVHAVTGVQLGYENAATNNGFNFTACRSCHGGPKVEFCVFMEQRTSEVNVPAAGYYENSTQRIGGSSAATAMMAGMAAVVWSKYPNASKEEILDKLLKSRVYQKRGMITILPGKNDNRHGGAPDMAIALFGPFNPNPK